MTIQRAMGLAAMDRGGTSDPYVTIKVGSQSEQKTTVQKKTLTPVWDESFSFRVESMDDALVLQVWDKDQLNDDFLGQAKLGTMRQEIEAPLRQCQSALPFEQPIELAPKRVQVQHVRGRIVQLFRA